MIGSTAMEASEGNLPKPRNGIIGPAVVIAELQTEPKAFAATKSDSETTTNREENQCNGCPESQNEKVSESLKQEDQPLDLLSSANREEPKISSLSMKAPELAPSCICTSCQPSKKITEEHKIYLNKESRQLCCENCQMTFNTIGEALLHSPCGKEPEKLVDFGPPHEPDTNQILAQDTQKSLEVFAGEKAKENEVDKTPEGKKMAIVRNIPLVVGKVGYESLNTLLMKPKMETLQEKQDKSSNGKKQPDQQKPEKKKNKKKEVKGKVKHKKKRKASRFITSPIFFVLNILF